MDETKVDEQLSKSKQIDKYRDMCDKYRGERLDWDKWFNTLLSWYGKVNENMDDDTVRKSKQLERNCFFLMMQGKDVAPEMLFQYLRSFEMILEEESDKQLYGKKSKYKLCG